MPRRFGGSARATIPAAFARVVATFGEAESRAGRPIRCVPCPHRIAGADAARRYDNVDRATLPALRLLCAQLAIGAAAIFARFALAGAGPVAVSALRLAIAAIVAIVVARGFAPLSKRREIAFAIAGLALAAHFAAWIGSLLYTSVAISTLLVTTTPLWTELYDVVRDRRPPAPRFVVTLVCALAGVALIALAHAARPAPVPDRALLGDVLALLGSVAIGAYLLIVRDASAGTPRVSTRRIVSRTYAWAAVALVAASAVSHQGPPPLGAGLAWFGVLAMALVSQLLGHTALNASLRHFTPSVVALSTLLEPAIAAALAAIVFHESIGAQAACGAALVLAAVGVTLWPHVARTAS
jgi:drug/metabolite transporter (DMT)-like permease